MTSAELGGKDPIFDPSDFRIPEEMLHFAAASETPFLYQHDEAFLKYAKDKSIGWSGRIRMEEQVESARMQAARLFNVDPKGIGFVSNVAEGVSIVAESVDFEPGENICIDASEFPSAVLPFMGARESGVEIRVANGSDPDRFAEIVDENTRIISTSTISYITGERLDPVYLRELADANNSLLLLDFTQEVGALPIDASVADFAFSSCYKFLLGCTGVAIAYWNQSRLPKFRPSTLGWYSVEFPPHLDYEQDPILKAGGARFSRGNVSYPSVYVLNVALSYLRRTDPEILGDHVLVLGGRLIEGLRSMGIEPTTPSEDVRRGPNVCFLSEEGGELMRKLADRSIIVINIDDTIRVSLHGYNYASQVDELLGALREEWRG